MEYSKSLKLLKFKLNGISHKTFFTCVNLVKSFIESSPKLWAATSIQFSFSLFFLEFHSFSIALLVFEEGAICNRLPLLLCSTLKKMDSHAKMLFCQMFSSILNILSYLNGQMSYNTLLKHLSTSITAFNHLNLFLKLQFFNQY